MNVFLRAEVVFFLNDMQDPFFDGLDAIEAKRLAKEPKYQPIDYEPIT